MKPIRITRLAPGEWYWRCYCCHKQDTIGTQPAAMALAHAHYILAHWRIGEDVHYSTAEMLERINVPVQIKG